MFSNEERMIYAKRQLVEVICQLRFPETDGRITELFLYAYR